MAKKSKKKRRTRTIRDGDSESLTVRRFSGDVSCPLSRKMLRYLGVKPGDKLNIVARGGSLEVAPVMSIREEIDQYLSI